MLRWQQKQIIEIIQTLREAHDEVEQFLVAGRGNSAVGLLGDCQETAEAMAKVVDVADFDKTAEEYCEALYKRNIGQKQDLNYYLNKLETIVRSARVRREIVFMPYKASMWDSLESIYLAARLDENCECFVVVLPYYDKLSDGTLGRFHYEGSEFPEEIAITDWPGYDLELRRPDVIYIHNPYDEINTLTEVPKQFFSQNLKEYAGLLVYCPYLIHSEIISDIMALTPAVLRADRTIVQSENIKRQYLKSLKTFCKERGYAYSKFGFSDKIVALGSPKLDKIINLKRKDVEPFDRFGVFVKRARAAGKKIVLYNISLETMWRYTVKDEQYSEVYFQKLKCVFDFFEACEEAVLVWRPHPLMEQSMSSMRPGLYEHYCELIREFKQKQIGFYDMGGDLYRALEAADCCYGDESSVNLLLQASGKPVLVQSMSMLDYEGVCKSPEEVEDVLNRFFIKADYNSFIFYESINELKLGTFIHQLHVIEKYRKRQSELYRKKFVNADGTAGEKIFKYSVECLNKC